MKPYEVRHPDGDLPHPQFDTWQQALAAQKEWNKEVPGHKARKIPAREIPVEHTCPKCAGAYTGWPHEKGSECLDCFTAAKF